ncbi:hypothetical protein ILYODFUR_035562 [Ilyodon furcidens]|uniref:Uncharacterized protein n=1 Tax=Ilyodon furcidens TaxID=33524 RepID=A0ABV0V8T2_9TELE
MKLITSRHKLTAAPIFLCHLIYTCLFSDISLAMPTYNRTSPSSLLDVHILHSDSYKFQAQCHHTPQGDVKPYWDQLILAGLCGLGGSMANHYISPFGYVCL